MSLRDEKRERDLNNNIVEQPSIYCKQDQHDEIARQTAEFLAKKGKIIVCESAESTIPESKTKEERKKMKVLDKKRFAHKMEHAKAKRELEKTLPYPR